MNKKQIPKICLTVIHWNQEELTIATILSLKKINNPNVEIILVDNGSDNGSGISISEKFDDIILVRSETNLGYAGGANLGFSSALERSADYVFLLNNDIDVDKEIIHHLLSVMESPDYPHAGILAPKIYFYDPPDIIWYGGGDCDMDTGICQHIDYGKIDNEMNCRIKECTFINGCAMFIKREVIEKVGFLDTSYFHTGEDVDYSIRASRAGFKLMFVPDAKLWHKIRASTGGNVKPKYMYNYYEFRNRLLIFRKYFLKNNMNFKTIAFMLNFYIRHIYYEVRRGNVSGAVSILHGTFDAVIGKCGKTLK
ncbi:MAG: glycosyltransferase family 2 protein [Proteobacteria bacterium]|nr:glycosyltransferase family 2 protein [Pseudomonadota bacterium]